MKSGKGIILEFREVIYYYYIYGIFVIYMWIIT